MDHGHAITLHRPDGQDAPGLFFAASAADAPGLVLIQEWWGINDQIQGIGRRLAAAGYRVVIPDLYRGRSTAAADEANHLMSGLDWAGAVRDIAGALAFLKDQAPSAPVGLTGFCMGGALTIAGLCNVPGFTAGVCFYGIPPAALADPTTLKVPLQAHFAEFDDWCTPAAVSALEDQLRRSSADYELHRYAAKHAFLNESRPEVYDPASATDAWRRTLEFFHRHLGGQAPRAAH